MLPTERRAALSLALIYMVRMLGLFSVLPVFVLFAGEFKGSTPFLVGLALGIYGLFQAALQIPLGLLSDKIGRKKTIAIGLIVLGIGSVVAAMSESIYGVIVGRALQGAGAIAAALMALAADLSREEQRTKMMAMLGASIGVSFLLALLLGPILITFLSVQMLFWFTAASAVFALVILFTAVPDPEVSGFHADTTARVASLGELFRFKKLQQLNISIFSLHLLITATFVAVPVLLRDAGLDSARHWQVYLPGVLLSVLAMIIFIYFAERKQHMRLVLLICIAGLALTQAVFVVLPQSVVWLFVGLLLFFSFLNTLEALLPSLVSRIAPAGSRGGANGIYSSSQFLGGFVGGAGGGWLVGQFGFTGLYLVLMSVCLLWFMALRGFTAPKLLTTHRRRLSAEELARGDSVVRELGLLPGVQEVVLSPEEGVAYMKVDKARFKPAS